MTLMFLVIRIRTSKMYSLLFFPCFLCKIYTSSILNYFVIIPYFSGTFEKKKTNAFVNTLSCILGEVFETILLISSIYDGDLCDTVVTTSVTAVNNYHNMVYTRFFF